ncbi:MULTISPECIES: hypothetical protein [unclassified Pedobacter]|uniref:hypothetical protein n=1 Tax=unclassified Pedobacter TaxID=2628915 RepID=UPI001DD8DFA6|nr:MULTISPECIES: hypothetical protein [unclassified Pedobacter]CAH0265287.1 hypothetical protein SRABI36_03580 [Pedobacter sp. Bi36]CAH0291719.1 hypothetical protein SRABI126_04074 [Pedobacter sp. Bi126]
METDDKFRVASNMVLFSLLLGVSNIFFQGIEGTAEIVLSISVLIFRYFVSTAILRRFSWAKYLLLLLIARSLFKLIEAENIIVSEIFYKVFPIILQLVLVSFAFILMLMLPGGILQKKSGNEK